MHAIIGHPKFGLYPVLKLTCDLLTHTITVMKTALHKQSDKKYLFCFEMEHTGGEMTLAEDTASINSAYSDGGILEAEPDTATDREDKQARMSVDLRCLCLWLVSGLKAAMAGLLPPLVFISSPLPPTYAFFQPSDFHESSVEFARCRSRNGCKPSLLTQR